jgi:hypothetical protein
LRAGAAFFLFLVDRFFAFVLFAMIDLPILLSFKTRAVFTLRRTIRHDTLDTSHLTGDQGLV